MKNTGLIIIGAGIAAYFLFLAPKSGEGGAGGSLSNPLDILGAGAGNVTGVAPQDASFQPSQYLLDLIAKKSVTSTSASTPSNSFSSWTGGLGTSADLTANTYPVVMYDTKKGGNQLAVQSAPQAPSIFSKLTGGLGTAKDLVISSSKKSSSSSLSPNSKSISYGGGNSAGSSSTLHSRMGVK